MSREFFYYFGIPNGAIWGNVLAEPIIGALTLLLIYPFRNHLMKKFVKFHHKHKEAHLASLSKEKDEPTQDGLPAA